MSRVSIPRLKGVREMNTLKPYPLVSDLREPARRVTVPASHAWWSAKNWLHARAESRKQALKAVQDFSSIGCGCWRHLRVPSPEGINSPGVIGCNPIIGSTVRGVVTPSFAWSKSRQANRKARRWRDG